MDEQDGRFGQPTSPSAAYSSLRAKLTNGSLTLCPKKICRHPDLETVIKLTRAHGQDEIDKPMTTTTPKRTMMGHELLLTTLALPEAFFHYEANHLKTPFKDFAPFVKLALQLLL